MSNIGQNHPSNRLTGRLKQFAFSESPQFKAGQTSNMRLSRTFKLPFDTRPDICHEEDDDIDSMSIKLGFEALRGTGVHGANYYMFSASCRATRPVESTELRLSADDWQAIGAELEVDTDDGKCSDLPESVRSAIDWSGLDCAQYIESDYVLTNSTGRLELTEESGYTVDDKYYGVVDREDFYDNSGIGHPESRVGDANSEQSGQSIEDFLRFNEIVADMRQDIDRTGDVMSFAAKQREMLFIVRCLRNKTIPL